MEDIETVKSLVKQALQRTQTLQLIGPYSPELPEPQQSKEIAILLLTQALIRVELIGDRQRNG